jgi:hypothetical protein
MARGLWCALRSADAYASSVKRNESANKNGARGDDRSIRRVCGVIASHGGIAHSCGRFVLEEHGGAAFLNGGFVGGLFLKRSTGRYVRGRVVRSAALGCGGFVVDGDGAGEFSGDRPDKRHGGRGGNGSSGGRDHDDVGVHSGNFVALFGCGHAHGGPRIALFRCWGDSRFACSVVAILRAWPSRFARAAFARFSSTHAPRTRPSGAQTAGPRVSAQKFGRRPRFPKRCAYLDIGQV